MLHIQKNKALWSEAFSLIQESYEKELYRISEEDCARYNDTRTLFTLHKEDSLIGTISLIEHQGKGSVPLGTLYEQELDNLLTTYPKIFEVSNFAMSKKDSHSQLTPESIRGTQLLFKAVLEEAKNACADALVIAINPKHFSFYRLLGFEKFGEEKIYPFVNAPAVALLYDVNKKGSYNTFFGA